MKTNKLLKSYFIFFIIQVSTLAFTSAQVSVRADSLYNANEYEEAILEYKNIYNSSKTKELEKATSSFQLGKSYYLQSNLTDALNWFEKASTHYEKLKDFDNYHITQGRIAMILDDQGEYQKAIEISTKSVNYFVEKKDSNKVVDLANNLALYYYHLGEVQRSIKLYNQTIAWAGSKRKDVAAKCYNQLGNIWADDLGNEKKALEYYQKSLKMKLESGASVKSISFSYNNIGISYKNLGNIDSSMYYYQKALEYAKKTNEPQTQLNPLINIANNYKRIGDYVNSINTYNEALKISQYASAREVFRLHINIAMNYNLLQKYHKALEHLNTADSLIKISQVLNDKRDLHIQKAYTYSKLNNFQKAFEEQQIVTTLTDSIFKRERDQEMADLMVQFETEQKDKEILKQEKIIQLKEIENNRKTILFLVIAGFLVLIAGFLFYLFKQKESQAKQAHLELKLAQEKKRADLQEERLRISRELHDNIGSYLTLISASIEQIPTMSEPELKAQFPDLQKALSLSIRELRKTVWLLNSEEVSVDAIALRMRDFFKPLNQNDLKIHIHVEGNSQLKLKDVQATHLIRIIQEAVNNAYKYAEAKNIYIELKADKHLYFNIYDDGKGFDIKTTNPGNGIANMKARTKELNGSINIDSLATGTRIEGNFPINTYNYV